MPSNTFEWDKHNLACVNTWAFLRGLGQLKPVFSQSGGLKMSELTFFGAAPDDEQRRRDARELALQLDRIFIKALLAKYESGVTLAKAVDDMTNLLVTAAKTVRQLAEVVDASYDFRGELK